MPTFSTREVPTRISFLMTKPSESFRDLKTHSESHLAPSQPSMNLPTEYGWTLVALGGAVMTTIYGGIKVRSPHSFLTRRVYTTATRRKKNNY